MNEIATLAGGCFWCTEAIFSTLRGVAKVVPGYCGGTIANPTYQEVCSEQTSHAEAIQIEFDPKVISFSTLLDVFWHTHDPTTVNQQGADFGSQYRSAIFYHNPEQQRIAQASKQKFDLSKEYPNLAVTEIVPAASFYPAEDYHRNFYANNPNQGYCRVVITPKLQKLRQQYGKLLSS